MLLFLEYNVYAYHTKGFDYESGLGSITVDVSCGDSVGTVMDTLIITIENAVSLVGARASICFSCLLFAYTLERHNIYTGIIGVF